MSGTTTYVDTGWSGTPAAIEAGLATYGWQISNGIAAVIDPTKQGTIVAVVAGPLLDGVQYALVRSTAAVTLPAGVSAVGPDHTSALAGVFMPDGTQKPSVISAAAFFARFTAAETAAIWAACQAVPALGVGLMQGLANQSINLNDSVTQAWVNGLAQANALTTTRAAVVLTP